MAIASEFLKKHKEAIIVGAVIILGLFGWHTVLDKSEKAAQAPDPIQTPSAESAASSTEYATKGEVETAKLEMAGRFNTAFNKWIEDVYKTNGNTIIRGFDDLSQRMQAMEERIKALENAE